MRNTVTLYRKPQRAIEAEPVDLLVVQGTSFCNIDCRYCYLPDRNDAKRMPVATLRTALEGLQAGGLLSERLTCLWHSGEPLTVGIGHMRQMFAAARAALPRTRLQFSVQTNGVLLDQRWTALFTEHQVEVGLSCDGPPLLHDATRIDRHGRGTSAAVERAAAELRRAGLPIALIAVLSSRSLDHAHAIFDYFEAMGATSVSFNIEENEGVHRASSLGSADLPRLIGFLSDYFLRVFRTSSRQKLRELNTGMRLLQGERLFSPAYEQRPFRILSLTADGDVSCLSPELAFAVHPRHGPLKFASVHQPGWVDALREDVRLAAVLQEIEAGNARCQAECSYFDYCGGGSPSNKLAEHGSFDAAETIACRFYVKAVIQATMRYVRTVSGDSPHAAPL